MIRIPRVFRMDRKAFYLFALYFLFMFQTNIQDFLGPYQYFDELLSVYFVARFFLDCFVGRTYMLKEIPICISLIGTLLVVGVVGNYTAKVQTHPVPVIIDSINTVKCFLVFLCLSSRTFTRKTLEDFLRASSGLVTILVYCALPFCFLNQVVNIGMTYDIRFGLHSFTFIFKHAGYFNMICYIWIITLSGALILEDERKKTIRTIFLAMFLWASTLRSRAFMYLFVYACLLIMIKVYKDIKFNLFTGSGVALVGFYIVKDQFTYYFTNPRTPRSILLRFGFVTMQNYFPIGAGFGTYGSSTASKYYSALYYRYGFDHAYGLNYDDRQFLTDGYWPQIMGQLGAIGCALIMAIIILILLIVLKATKHNAYLKLGALIGYITVMVSTIATNSLANYISIMLLYTVGILCARIVDDENTICEMSEKVV